MKKVMLILVAGMHPDAMAALLDVKAESVWEGKSLL